FGDLLSFTLTAFVELMDHGIVSWDTFSVAFIKKIAGYVNKSAMDTAVLQRSLAILESMVLNSQDLYHKVAQEITIGQLIPHLQGISKGSEGHHLRAAEDCLRRGVWTLTTAAVIEKRKSMYTRDYKKLGFIIVLENSSREDKHECPFGRSSIELTKMLCEILKVGELPSENCHDFHPMFFTHDRSFEEFFCICIQLLNKNLEGDESHKRRLQQVMQVVREQIMRALTLKPNSLDQFKSRLQNLSYTEILKIRQSERMNQEDFQSRPILELREKIQPEIMELIKQQRLNRLCDGTCFRKISSRRRQDKFWYCRLSPNHKVLHYGDLEESPQGEVPHDSLQDKLYTDCPPMVLSFFNACWSLYQEESARCQLAPLTSCLIKYCVWTDGLNALLGKEMTSDYTKSDMDTLLSMEMKLRLLDLENIQIPEAPPPIPKEPSNYDFVYDCN
ncbi:hypothetical protein KUCAC02_011752, partial [Chaenocephalus aceratus]